MRSMSSVMREVWIIFEQDDVLLVADTMDVAMNELGRLYPHVTDLLVTHFMKSRTALVEGVTPDGSLKWRGEKHVVVDKQALSW